MPKPEIEKRWFFIKRSFEYRGKRHTPTDRYVQLPYNDDVRLLIARRFIMLSGSDNPFKSSSAAGRTKQRVAKPQSAAKTAREMHEVRKRSMTKAVDKA